MKLENSMINWLAKNCLDKVDCPVELLCMSIMIKDNETPDIYLIKNDSKWMIQYLQSYDMYEYPLLRKDRLAEIFNNQNKDEAQLSVIKSTFFDSVTYKIKKYTENDSKEKYRLTIFNRNKEIKLLDETNDYLLKIFKENHLNFKLEKSLSLSNKTTTNKNKI